MKREREREDKMIILMIALSFCSLDLVAMKRTTVSANKAGASGKKVDVHSAKHTQANLADRWNADSLMESNAKRASAESHPESAPVQNNFGSFENDIEMSAQTLKNKEVAERKLSRQSSSAATKIQARARDYLSRKPKTLVGAGQPIKVTSRNESSINARFKDQHSQLLEGVTETRSKDGTIRTLTNNNKDTLTTDFLDDVNMGTYTPSEKTVNEQRIAELKAADLTAKDASRDIINSNKLSSQRFSNESNPIHSVKADRIIIKSARNLDQSNSAAVKQWFSTALQSILESLSHGQRISSQALSQALQKLSDLASQLFQKVNGQSTAATKAGDLAVEAFHKFKSLKPETQAEVAAHFDPANRSFDVLAKDIKDATAHSSPQSADSSGVMLGSRFSDNQVKSTNTHNKRRFIKEPIKETSNKEIPAPKIYTETDIDNMVMGKTSASVSDNRVHNILTELLITDTLTPEQAIKEINDVVRMRKILERKEIDPKKKDKHTLTIAAYTKALELLQPLVAA